VVQLISNNVDREQFCKTQKCEEDVRVLCSELSVDGVDVRHPGLSVFDVYDNPHIISFFLVDIPVKSLS